MYWLVSIMKIIVYHLDGFTDKHEKIGEYYGKNVDFYQLTAW